MSSDSEITSILSEAKKLAKRYRALTGKPLGITGEVAEFVAASMLNLKLAEARTSGYDATGIIDGRKVKIQIKGRCLLSARKPGQGIGSIKLDKEWDVVILVLLDADMEPIEIIKANRDVIQKAILAPGSKARNERGALRVQKFKSIGKTLWKR